MAGKKGRSGGWNRIPVEQHILRGSFNPTRHGGHRVRTATAAALSPEPLPPTLLEGLQSARGKAFVTDCWTTYGNWTPPACVKLRLAGQLLDDLEGPLPLRARREAQRLLLTTIEALQLRD